MPRCPNCSREAPEGSRFCPGCATELGDDQATRTSLPSGTVPPPPPNSSFPSHPDNARFLPGSMVADRYRVVGLLGAGGMGEVYRADDLKLGQPVALKFLPREVEQDEDRRQRLMNEVRLALRITHPNVCRVYDVGEVDGQHFISMEYVDGEDLASLLRRIGRLPEERATEIARQLCAGLAAAHEEGILHRDLKPANVMIDGRGRPKITDFGLAEISGSVEGAEVRAGTPAYMAPEQLSGSGVSERSDIYSLGLVLYELFTGKQAYKPGTVAEAVQMHSTPPTSPTSHVTGLDPAIEAVLLRALDTNPARRPASALAVAAALPGGDPLAAALAAGETPSPEMVAEAGDAGSMAPVWVALCLLVIVGCLIGFLILRPRQDVVSYIETPHSTGALRERAQLMAERLGFEASPEWTAHSIGSDWVYRDWLSEETDNMVERIEAERPPVYHLWYRTSPERIIPHQHDDRVTTGSPPIDVPGMMLIAVDPHARLIYLEAVPPAKEPEVEAELDVETLWQTLFDEAGLDRDRFESVEVSWVPYQFADARAAWEGTLAEAPDITLRVETASYRGSPVGFRIIGPWTPEPGTADEPGTFELPAQAVGITIFFSVMIGLGLLARRNLRSGRSDLQGAIRVAGYIFVVELLSRTFGGGYLYGADALIPRFMPRMMEVVFLSMLVFMAYIALEPYVRRLWPTTMISWSRLIGGRLRDPLVGRDVLIGAAAGALLQMVHLSHAIVPPIFGLTELSLVSRAGWRTAGIGPTLGETLTQLGGTVGMPMLFLLTLVLLRLLLRNSWAAIGVFLVASTVLPGLGSDQFFLDFPVALLTMGLTLFVLLRVGLLAMMSLMLYGALSWRVDTLDPDSWVATDSMVNLAVLLIVPLVAAVVASRGRGLLQEEV